MLEKGSLPYNQESPLSSEDESLSLNKKIYINNDIIYIECALFKFLWMSCYYRSNNVYEHSSNLEILQLLNVICAICYRSTGFFRKILKKRPHKEAQTPDDGDLTMATALNEKESIHCKFYFF